jgi:hypothetical protein
MSGTEGPLYRTTAGADLSSTGQYLFIYLDPSDSYKAKLLTSPVYTTNPVGVLQNAPADDAEAKYRRGAGLATVYAGGAITPWAPVTCNSASKAVVAGPGDMVLGYYKPKNTAAGVLSSAASGDKIEIVQVAGKTDTIATSGVAVGYHDFATDGGAVSTITLRDATGLAGSSVTIPSGSLVTFAHVYVDTTYTSAGDLATIGLDIGGIDIVADVAIGTGTPWDAGGRNGIQAGTGLLAEPTSSAAALTATIGVEAVTAGAMRVYVHYTTVAAE